MDSNYSPSHIWVDDRKGVTFDTLIVRIEKDCEAIYTAYGDGSHVTQTAIRFEKKDGGVSHYGATGYALHCGEVEPIVRKPIGVEVVAILNGKIVYHKRTDGKVLIGE